MTDAAPLRLRSDPDWRKYFSASVLSFAGGKVTEVALPVLVYTLTGSPLLTAVVVAAEAVSYLVVGLPAGAIADRYDRRRIMIGSDVVSALAVLTIPVAGVLDRLAVPHVIAVAVIAAVSSVFNNAAELGALPTLVRKDDLTAAYSALTGVATVAGIAVPALTGLLLSFVAPQIVISIDVLSFLCSAALLLAVRKPMSAERQRVNRASLTADMVSGLAFLWRHPTIRPVTLVGIAQSAFVGATFAQFVPFADRALHVSADDWRIGSLYTAWSIGALVASIVLPRLARRVSAPWITLLTTPLSALGGLLCATAPGWLPTVLIICVWSAVLSMNASITVIHRQAMTPEHLVSRVSATGRMLAWGIGNPVGAFLGGLVGQAYGPTASFVLGAGFGALAAVLAWLSPLRRAAPRPESAPVG